MRPLSKPFSLTPKRTFLCIAAVLSLVFIATLGTAHANVNDFTIASYDINFDLSQSSDKHSLLTTTEKIVADFPQSDQNHGLERALTKDYNGHKTSLNVQSVTDANGNSWNYSTYNSSHFKVLRIGDQDRYVHGKQTFIITYTQRDVTRSYKDTHSDEFYWDTNGTDWRVPIENLSVTTHIDDSLRNKFVGNAACYQGKAGSTYKCSLSRQDTTFSAAALYLRPGENVTVAFGFEPGTFAAYKATPGEKLLHTWKLVQLTLLPIVLILIVLIVIRFYRQSNRSKEQTPIIAEYLPPAEASVAASAKTLGVENSFSAQLIDLAVRHYIKIYQTKARNLLGFKKDDYSIEIIKPVDDLRDEEKEFIGDVFNGETSVGTTLALSELKKDLGAYLRFKDNDEKLTKLGRDVYQLRARATDAQRNWYSRVALLSLILAILLLSPTLLLLSVIVFIMGRQLWPLTDKGLALVKHLKGLKLYIKVAEQERLKMLQSPEGALKVQVDATDTKQLVKLYEKVLPYAILFGQSKEWNKQLGQYYEATNSQPDWFYGTVGVSAFNAASFSSAIDNFSSSASSSSPTGGSSGGGSSGGGGGGGGGGGW